MLYVQEKVVKLGGIYLEGQVTSVEVQEAKNASDMLIKAIKSGVLEI